MKTFEEQLNFEDGLIYLKVHDGIVDAYGDIRSLQNAEVEQKTGKLFDACLTPEEWENSSYTARLENGKIVLGLFQNEIRQRQELVIRNERYLRLRKIDKINPLYWEEKTPEEIQELREYRRALLDITDLEGFPWNGDIEAVPWPKKPSFFDF